MIARSMLILLIIAPHAVYATTPRSPNGPVVRFTLPGIQVDPVVGDGHVVYRSVEIGFPHNNSPHSGVNMWLDVIPMSPSTRVGIYNGGIAEGQFPESDGGVFIFNYPDSFPTTQEFAGKMNFFQHGISPGFSTIVNHTNMKAKSSIRYSGQSISDAKFAWMQLGPDGDWDVWWQHGANSYITTDTRNLGLAGVNDVDPSVGNDCIAWAQGLRQTHHMVKGNCISTGVEFNVGLGRHPQLIDNLWGTGGTSVIYENRVSSTYQIGVYSLASGRTLPLPGLPSSPTCAAFRRPKAAADGRFVVYRGEDCGTKRESWLLLTVRGAHPTSTCTIIVASGSLPTWMNDDDPAQYDVDANGMVVAALMVDTGQNPPVPETDLFYFKFDAAQEGCL